MLSSFDNRLRRSSTAGVPGREDHRPQAREGRRGHHLAQDLKLFEQLIEDAEDRFDIEEARAALAESATVSPTRRSAANWDSTMGRKRNGREPRPEPSRYEIQLTRAAECGWPRSRRPTRVALMPRSSDWPRTGIPPDQRSFRARLTSTEFGLETTASFTKSRRIASSSWW